MKIITLKKKRIIMFLGLIVFVSIIFNMTSSFAMQHYYKVDFSTGIVTATILNVRSGPSTKYEVITTVKKNEYIRVFAGVGDWYVVQVEGDYVGAVSKKYVKPIYSTSTDSVSTERSSEIASKSVNITSDEQEVFDLINKQRTNNGLLALKIDENVQKVAKIKAQDMVDNNYFAHSSPTYGTPFEMLKKFNVSYSSAGENIAGNSTNSGAVTAWMNSAGHKANILNSNYNYTGIGVVKSNTYGKIYVQMFIRK